MSPLVEQILRDDNIPTPPSVAIRLLDLVSQPDVDIDDLTKVLSADPRLSARLIGYCNSPMVGAKRTITTLQQAVMVLGMRTLRLLSLSFSLMDTKNASDFDFDAFWRSSLAMAVTAKTLARRSGESPDEQFLLGLLFNIGVIGIGTSAADDYAALLDTVDRPSLITAAMEHESLGTTRYEIGGRLLEKWSFPEVLVNPVLNFNTDELIGNDKMLSLSNNLSELLLSVDVSETQLNESKSMALNLAGLDDTKFGELFDEIVAEWNGYETLFQYDSIAFSSMQDLEARAKESMMNISLGMDSEMQVMAEEQKALEETAMHDGLTSLKNRAAYDREVASEFDHHRNKQLSIGLIVIDVDHFKSFNDTHGHAAGDEVLRQVGKCLSENVRNYDTVYRYGGEEFVAVIKKCDFESVALVANRLRAAIERMEIEFEGKVLRVTASLGGCWSEKTDSESVESVFKQADAFLYRAKRDGRNRCVVNDVDTSAVAT